MATEYGQRLKQARKHARLTQIALSGKTGIPQSTISTAEREGNGSKETPVYAAACGVDALWLATGKGEMLSHQDAISAQPNASKPNMTSVDGASAVTDIEAALHCLRLAALRLNSGNRKVLSSCLAAMATEPEDHTLEETALHILSPPSAQLKPETGGYEAAA